MKIIVYFSETNPESCQDGQKVQVNLGNQDV